MKLAIHATLGSILACTSLSNHASEGDTSLFDMSLEQLLNIPVKTRLFTEEINQAPRPLTVFTEKTLETNLIDSIYDLSLFIPNFSFHPNFGRLQERPVIRGVAGLVGDPPAGILIDGINVTDSVATLNLNGLAQVEVLRGPEAALYGRSTFSGAINFVTKRPNQDTFATLNSKAGSHGYQAIFFDANHAFNKTLALNLHAKHYALDDFVSNTLEGANQDYGSEKSQSLSLGSLWSPSDTITLYYRGTLQKDRDGHIPTYVQKASFNNCFLDTTIQYFCGELAERTAGFNTGVAPWPYELNKDIARHFVEVEYQKAQRFDIQLKAGLNTVDSDTTFDGDLYEYLGLATQIKQKKEDFTAELITNLYFDTDRLLLGASYYSLDDFFQSNAQFIAFDSFNEGDKQNVNVDNISLFASYDHSLTKTTKLSVDLRYAQDKITYLTSGENNQYSDSNMWHSVSPRINLSKQFDNNWLMYISVANSRKPGGFNDNLEQIDYIDNTERQRVLEFIAYEEEKLTSYDFGFKGEIVEQRLFLNSNLFYYDWTNLQLTQSLGYTNNESVTRRVPTIANGGESQNQGFEIELEAIFTNQLSTRFSLGYTKTTLKNTQTTAQADLTDNGDVSGNAIPNAPEFDLFSGLYYQNRLKNGIDVKSHLSIAYESKRYVAEHNLAYIGDYTRVNSSVSIGKNNWEVQLWAKNLFGDDTPESAARFGDAANFFQTRAFGISYQKPRQIGLSLTLTF